MDSPLRCNYSKKLYHQELHLIIKVVGVVKVLVDPRRFELLTPSLQTRCATVTPWALVSLIHQSHQKPRFGAGLVFLMKKTLLNAQTLPSMDSVCMVGSSHEKENRLAIQRQLCIVAKFALPVNTRYNCLMHLWDYREKDLKKTAWGRRYILQNMINLGPGRRKISKKLVKKYWYDLDIDPLRRNLLRYLIWGKR